MLAPDKVDTPNISQLSKEDDTASEEKSDAKKKTGLNPLLEAVEKMEKLPNKTPNIPPPIYTVSGRGLVYNCVGKHWACLDKKGHEQCQGHNKWAKENREITKCVPFDVYLSREDCSEAQIQKINTIDGEMICADPSVHLEAEK